LGRGFCGPVIKRIEDGFAPAIPPALWGRRLWESELDAPDPARRDCAREMGSLGAAVGSHTTGILPTKVGSGAGSIDIAVPIPDTWFTGDFEAGDALIFHDVTVHKALPNRTPSIRMSFDARYQKLSEPRFPRCLSRPGG
jgi:hypothetical protein